MLLPNRLHNNCYSQLAQSDKTLLNLDSQFSTWMNFGNPWKIWGARNNGLLLQSTPANSRAHRYRESVFGSVFWQVKNQYAYRIE